MVTNVTQEDVIDYYGTWFRFNRKGLAAMFTDPRYIPDDLDSKDDGEANGDKRVIDIGLIGTMEEVVLPPNKVRAFNELESSSVPLEGTLVHLHHTMKKIPKNAHKEGSHFVTMDQINHESCGHSNPKHLLHKSE
jgi:hypothetical protein